MAHASGVPAVGFAASEQASLLLMYSSSLVRLAAAIFSAAVIMRFTRLLSTTCAWGFIENPFVRASRGNVVVANPVVSPRTALTVWSYSFRDRLQALRSTGVSTQAVGPPASAPASLCRRSPLAKSPSPQ